MKINHINSYIEKIKPYKTASHKIWDVNASERNDILKLDWNEATIPPSNKVRNRIKKLTEENNFYNLYPSTDNRELITLISKFLQIPEKNVQYFAGSDAIHEYLAKIYIKENDKVLIQSPSYDNFRLTIEACGGKIFYSEINENFTFNKEKFEKDLEDIKPNFVYICNPNNPIGYTHSINYIEKLLINYPSIMFLIDEAYVEFSKNSTKDLVLKYENILITRTLSKAFALANFRFGYLISSKKNIKIVSSIRNPKNISTFAQEAAIGTFLDIQYMEKYVEEVTRAREYFVNKLKKYERFLIPHDSKANFIIIKFKENKIKSEFIKFLSKNNIYIRELKQSSLLYDCIRITIGTSEQMERVLKTIDNFFKNEN
jgi:histidinol-phosphate aminotransferase